ncbi:MAG: hypothetical protein GXX96_26745 [Planctomycetaceae bacterium]|nr:hypothetical protein [Planctomycetaceae bacterium]
MGRLKEKLEAEAKERLSAAGKAGREKQLGGVPKCAQAQSAGKTRDKLAAQFGVSHGPAEESAFHCFRGCEIGTFHDRRAVQGMGRTNGATTAILEGFHPEAGN